MSTFFAMGGHAAYIWPCYILTILALCWVGHHSWQKAKKAGSQLAALEADGRPDQRIRNN